MGNSTKNNGPIFPYKGKQNQKYLFAAISLDQHLQVLLALKLLRDHLFVLLALESCRETIYSSYWHLELPRESHRRRAQVGSAPRVGRHLNTISFLWPRCRPQSEKAPAATGPWSP